MKLYYDERDDRVYSSPAEKKYSKLTETEDVNPLLFLHGLFLIPLPSGIGLLLRALFYVPENICWIALSAFLVIMILLDIFCMRRNHYTLFFIIAYLGVLIAIADIVLIMIDSGYIEV